MRQHSLHSSRPRLRPLVLALGLALSTSAALADSPPGLRADPAARIFPSLRPDLSSARTTHAAATLTVSNCADEGPGSLRETIAAALDGDTVDLSALACSVITLETGAIPVMLNDLTLVGPGAQSLAIDGALNDRAFLHYGGGTFELDGLTIRNGSNRATGSDVAGGGCIASAGYLTLTHSVVSHCQATGVGAYGGAVYAYKLTMSDSTLSGNLALGALPGADTAAFGGAAFVYSLALTDSTVTGNAASSDVNQGHTSYSIGGGLISVHGGLVSDSTIDSNTSYGRGGGVASFDTLVISNSTVSGNVAEQVSGGGIFMRQPATINLANSTVTANTAATGGGGVYLTSNDAIMHSSIVFGNAAASGGADLGSRSSAMIGGGNNLVGVAATSVTLPPDTLHTDPLLAPLAGNGGPTRTHALDAGSPAIDAGNNATHLPNDQRGAGFVRTFGSGTDIGAFERQGEVTAPLAIPALSASMAALLTALLAALGLRKRRTG